MRRGPEGNGKQIGVFLARTGQGIVHHSHNTRTTTSSRRATPTPMTGRDTPMDNLRMHQHRLQQ